MSASLTSSSTSAGAGTSIPFEYREEQVKECVVERGEDKSPPCMKLYLQFLKHYRPDEYDQVSLLFSSEATLVHSLAPSWLPSSYSYFHRTLQLVFEHNHQKHVHHKLRLNQFADQPHASAYQRRVENAMNDSSQNDYIPKWQQQVDQFWNEVVGQNEQKAEENDYNHHHHHDDPESHSYLRQLKTEVGDLQVSLLDSPSAIRQVSHKGQRHHQRSLFSQETHHSTKNNKQHRHERHHHSHHKDTSASEPHQQSYYQRASESYQQHSTLRLTTSHVSAKTTKATVTKKTTSQPVGTRVYMPPITGTPPMAFSIPQVPLSIHGMEVELIYKNNPIVSTTSSSTTTTTTDTTQKQNKGWFGGLFHSHSSPSNNQHQVTNEQDVTRDMPPLPHHSKLDEDTTILPSKGSQKSFIRSLNWASSNNPDGVALVHDVFDQGTCGSCWAFAATGSVEASAARTAARVYFQEGLQRMIDNQNSMAYQDPTIALQRLMEQTQIVEAETFMQLNLSIQELLDCDTAADQGCVGGNPLLAFFYIHRYGLVPWQEYPYVGYGNHHHTRNSPATTDTTVVSPTSKDTAAGPRDDQTTASSTASVLDPFPTGSDAPVPSSSSSTSSSSASQCQLDKIVNPVATVQSWGLLPKNHEYLIEVALKYIGPVAVGINGADPAFVNYGGGVFDSPECEQGANHALLIVGYGETNVTNPFGEDEAVRYWIARNSWGAGWGEQGYVRIKRGPGGKHIPGVCGIARSPSVALGGQLRPDRYLPLMDNAFQKTVMDPTKYHGRNSEYSEGHATDHPFCDSYFTAGTKRYNDCVSIANSYAKNPAIFLTAIAVVSAMFAIIPLTYAVVKRRRLARRLEAGTLSLDRGNRPGSNGSLRSAGCPSETTHLLTLKEAYASIHPEKDGKPRGRRIVIKGKLEQDPFQLSDRLWDSNRLVTAAAKDLEMDVSPDSKAAAAVGDESEDNDPLIGETKMEA